MLRKAREEKASDFLDRVEALEELADIDNMGPSALTSHNFIRNSGDTENAWKIKDKCIDYLRTHANPDDLEEIKGIVKGQ